MKKAIIILTLLSLITLGFCVYEGYLYINSLETLKEVSKTKSELIDTNMTLEKENEELEKIYAQKSQDLLNEDENCSLWEKQEEILKKIKE